MVTLTSFVAENNWPLDLTTAMMSDVLPSFIRVETNGSAPFCNIYVDVIGDGLFEAMIVIESTFGSVDETVMGTTAPFSAMSGAFNFISPEAV